MKTPYLKYTMLPIFFIIFFMLLSGLTFTAIFYIEYAPPLYTLLSFCFSHHKITASFYNALPFMAITTLFCIQYNCFKLTPKHIAYLLFIILISTLTINILGMYGTSYILHCLDHYINVDTAYIMLISTIDFIFYIISIILIIGINYFYFKQSEENPTISKSQKTLFILITQAFLITYGASLSLGYTVQIYPQLKSSILIQNIVFLFVYLIYLAINFIILYAWNKPLLQTQQSLNYYAIKTAITLVLTTFFMFIISVAIGTLIALWIDAKPISTGSLVPIAALCYFIGLVLFIYLITHSKLIIYRIAYCLLYLIIFLSMLPFNFILYGLAIGLLSISLLIFYFTNHLAMKLTFKIKSHNIEATS